MQIMNILDLCISYDEIEKIDTGLAQHTINTAGVNRTSIPSTIKNNAILHGAMDNFDHDENTPSDEKHYGKRFCPFLVPAVG